MKQFFAELFIWWHKETLGMRVWTALRGVYVGTDELGNRYYKHKRNDRRWVLYNGYAEASAIAPGWHGWMQHTVDTPPSAEDYKPRDWQRPHQPNLTGTALAYRPPGSIAGKARPAAAPDYQAWKPE